MLQQCEFVGGPADGEWRAVAAGACGLPPVQRLICRTGNVALSADASGLCPSRIRVAIYRRDLGTYRFDRYALEDVPA